MISRAARSSGSGRNRPFSGSSPLLPWAALFMAGLIGASMTLCGGRLVYSLDDAYIHLSVSEQIAAGGYGINPGEFSAPSSSPLWDFLLAPFAGTGVHVYIPLLVNLLCLLASLVFLRDVFIVFFPGLNTRAMTGLVLWFALVTNLFGLVLTGMEHSLQAFLTLAVFRGILQSAANGRVPGSMLAAMVLGPWVRYELLAVTLAAAVVLWVRGERGKAALSFGASLIPLAAFSFFLLSRGVPPLPGSVLVKLSDGGFSGGLFLSLTRRMFLLHTDLDALRFLVLCCLLPAARLFSPDRHSRHLLGFAAGVGAAHLLLGRFGWLGRYHVYALLAVVPTLFWGFRGVLERTVRSGRKIGVLAVFLPLTVFFLPELAATLATPLASRSIHLQHGVMRRIVLAYDDRIAANDIGWVSYGNPHPVLDLWGLANEESRRHYRERGTGWMARMVEEDGTGLVLLYPEFFRGEIPGEWRRMAVLGMSGPAVGVAYPEVDIYVTAQGDPVRVGSVLREVSATLPRGAWLRFEDCDE